MTADAPSPCDRERLYALLEQALAIADRSNPLIAAHLMTALALIKHADGAGQSSSR